MHREAERRREPRLQPLSAAGERKKPRISTRGMGWRKRASAPGLCAKAHPGCPTSARLWQMGEATGLNRSFVSGHDLGRAGRRLKRIRASAPEHSRTTGEPRISARGIRLSMKWASAPAYVRKQHPGCPTSARLWQMGEATGLNRGFVSGHHLGRAGNRSRKSGLQPLSAAVLRSRTTEKATGFNPWN